MVTFNVDSLDFVDDEEIRTGANDDFAMRYSSANSRLELEDLTAGAVGYIPQNVSTDLVGGKFAETVAEGKALADDGNVYDTIQEAEDNASSWVKVGPGDFRENLTIDTTGFMLTGSGEQSFVSSQRDTIQVTADNVAIKNLKIESANGNGVIVEDAISNVVVDNCVVNTVKFRGTNNYVKNSELPGADVEFDKSGSIDGPGGVINCHLHDGGEIRVELDDVIIYGNVFEDMGRAIRTASDGDDTVIGANRIDGTGAEAILHAGNDDIIFNNRISNADGGGVVDDGGIGTVLDANLVT